MSSIIVVTDKWHDERPSSEAYVTGLDDDGNSKERSAAIMGMLYRDYLKTERAESAIPIDDDGTYCDEEGGYAQIAWVNGDVRSYQLVEASDVPGMEHTDHKDAEPDDDTPWSGRVLSLSTVHIMPNAVDFLAEARNSDALQVYPNDASCVMHITDVKTALEYDIPLCVKDCIRYAAKKGYPWIYLGYEGKEQPGLPTYRGAWDKLL